MRHAAEAGLSLNPTDSNRVDAQNNGPKEEAETKRQLASDLERKR